MRHLVLFHHLLRPDETQHLWPHAEKLPVPTVVVKLSSTYA